MTYATGSFAPAITKEDIADYRQVAESASPEVRDSILDLCKMCEVFIETPPTTLHGPRHPCGQGNLDPLVPKEVKRIWDAVPWQHECDAIQALFDTLPSGPKDSPAWKLRKAAFHLAWYAQHLTKDLEPLTLDRL